MWNNTVTLCGRLTADPELKMASEKPVVNFTLAVQKLARDKDAVDFISCVIWNQSARYLNDYGHKGDYAAISGALRSRSYENNQGTRVYVTEVLADSIHLFPRQSKEEKAE
jgi:single-strand DNA-binding protein